MLFPQKKEKIMNKLQYTANEIGTSSQNRRNSEGAFAESDGRIVYAYSRFSGERGDDEACSDIAAIYSSDDGESWSEPVIIVRAADFGTANIMSVSFIKLANGDDGMFYLVKTPDGSTDIALSRSNDGCKTFYRTTSCLKAILPGYYVLNNDRAERLSDGRIVLPVAMHRRTYIKESQKEGVFDQYGEAHFFVSEDDGETFREAGGRWREAPVRVSLGGSAYSVSGLQEPGIIELKSGVIWMYARTDRGFQYESFSHDGLTSFCPAQPSRFTSPCSPMKLKRDPYQPEAIYAVWNPIPNYNGRGWPDRNPLVIAKSLDEGISWTGINALETDTNKNYCYPALHFTAGGRLLISYFYGGSGVDGMPSRVIAIDKNDVK